MNLKRFHFILAAIWLLVTIGIQAQVLDWGQGEVLHEGIVHLTIDRQIQDANGKDLLLKGNILRIDLKTPGLRFTATGRDSDWGKPMPDHVPKNGQQPFLIRTRRLATPAFLKECRKPVEQGGRGLDMVVAVNSCPWVPWEMPYLHRYAEPTGVNISDGVVVIENTRVKAHFVVWKNGEISLMDEIPPEKYPEIWLAASGFAIILRDGKPTSACADPARHPRTAYGLSADHQYLYILTVDGRQPKWSNGATYNDLVAIFLEAGATEAINLDGGGSTTLCYWNQNRNKPVVLSHATSQDGSCRPVAMSIGIYFTPDSVPPND